MNPVARRHFLAASPLAAALAAALPRTASAAGPEPRLTIRGKMLHQSAFQTLDSEGWIKGRGKWKAARGILTGEQTDPEPVYHANFHRTLTLPATACIEGEIRLDGAKLAYISISSSGAHVGRLFVSPASCGLREDVGGGENLPGQPVAKQAFRNGRWLPFILEWDGEVWAAQVDKAEIWAEHPFFKQDKNTLAFVVAGDGKSGGTASLRNLKAWEATPNPAWKKPKAAEKKD